MTDLIGEFMTVNFDTVRRVNQDTTPPERATFEGLAIPQEWAEDRTYISPLTVDIPISFYCVRNGKNTFQCSEDGGTSWTNIVLSNGNYNLDNLVIQLQAKLNASMTYTYIVKTATTDDINAPETGKLYFTASNITGQQPKFRFYLSNDDTSDTLFEALGFNFYGETYNDGAIFSFVNDQLTSPNVVQLNPENYIKIYCSAISGFDNNNIKGSQPFLVLNTRQVIPFSNMVFNNPDLLAYSRRCNKRSNTITFTITDEYDNILDLNGINWSITCIFFERENLSDKINNYIKYIINKDAQKELEMELKKK